MKPNGKLVFICDDHSHAVYFFALAKRLGLLTGDAVCSHIDQHDDGENMRSVLNPLNESTPITQVAELLKSEIDINEELAAAHRLGLFRLDHILQVTTKELGNERIGSVYGDRNCVVGRRADLEIMPLVLSRSEFDGKKKAADIDLDFLAYLYDDPLISAKLKRLKRDFPLSDVLPTIKRVAQKSDVVAIATSPDFFNVPEATLRYLIGAIVDAA